MKVESRTIVAASRERVWSTLVAWEEQPRWMTDAAGVRVLGESRRGVGVRLAVPTRVLGVRVFTDVLEVREWTPPATLVIVHRRLVRGEGTWTLEAEGNDVTRFTWVEDITLPVPVLGELALSAYRPALRRMMSRSLERFRRLVEAG